MHAVSLRIACYYTCICLRLISVSVAFDYWPMKQQYINLHRKYVLRVGELLDEPRAVVLMRPVINLNKIGGAE